jgi:Zn-dependent protease
MKWSWTIGRVAGIKLRVHATFLILLAWLALVDYRNTGTVAGALLGVSFALALFASVLLHELGHAIAGRRVGVPTRDITLLPIGGVARLEHIPDKPKQELGIALAGPAVTVLIVLVLALVLRLAGQPMLLTQSAIARGNAGAFLAQLMWLNVTLLLFNLLPAFPMDGGRVLRAVLALHRDYLQATEIAVRVGRAFALLFGVVGLFVNPFLMLIALFIWVSAAAESGALHERSTLSGVQVKRLMVGAIRTLAPNDTLDQALRQVLTGFQHDFPVVEGETVVGVLTRSGLLAGLAKSGTESLVGASMDRSFRTAEPDEPVERALARLRECQCRTLPVLSGGRLCGVLTAENVAEFVMIETALHASTRGAASESRLPATASR